MRRRVLLASSAATLLAPGAAAAQPGSRPTVGVLMIGVEGDAENRARLKAFNQGLAAAGWIDGKSIHNRPDLTVGGLGIGATRRGIAQVTAGFAAKGQA